MQGRDLAVVLGAVVLIVLFLGLLSGGSMMGPGMMGWGGYGSGPWLGIPMVLFWTLVIGGGALLLASLFRQGQPAGGGTGPGGTRPADILKERYARGEISREQYEQMLRDLA